MGQHVGERRPPVRLMFRVCWRFCRGGGSPVTELGRTHGRVPWAMSAEKGRDVRPGGRRGIEPSALHTVDGAVVAGHGGDQRRKTAQGRAFAVAKLGMEAQCREPAARGRKDLWDGEWPEFVDMEAFNRLLQDLTSLWNDLARHQSGTKSFRLVRWAAGPNTADLERLCQTRTEEPEGFLEGLYGGEEVIHLPESASKSLGYLGEINAMMHGVLDLTRSELSAPPSGKELAATVKNV